MDSGFLGNAETLQYYDIKEICEEAVQAAASIVCYCATGPKNNGLIFSSSPILQ